ncbi:IclR family transcriptional regulator [Oceanomicrobium pacificus]|uniref:Helix-turn-helix domain-containing protein n=1 Tax=Oceanomicrobium pacificus TaxID=2692916 RepID=A0A6B0TQF3_9RHOB|nr:IclR family transcriptional regulator [Oceanomicrobium pacificus]MXU66887.1 helix-turn-helix domain-containing protein [Oceanomicrobium pacificus]
MATKTSVRSAQDLEKYSAPALSKGLDILELLATQTRGLKKAEVAAALDRSVSEIYRMLAVLQSRGYVMLDPESERYSLTLKMFEMSHRHPPTKRLSAVAGEIMEEYAHLLNQSLHLAILHGSDILVIAQVDPPDNNITAVRLGARVPITYTASGACLVFKMPKDRIDALCARSPNTTRDMLRQFDENIEQVAREGYCQSPSLTISGIYNVSVPVFSYAGEVAAALTTPFIRRLTNAGDPDLEACRTAMIEAGQKISDALGAGAALDDQPS